MLASYREGGLNVKKNTFVAIGVIAAIVLATVVATPWV